MIAVSLHEPPLPARVKVQGDLFHGRLPTGAVYIGRQAPGLRKSPYANPYRVRQYGLAESLRLYVEHLRASPDLVAKMRRELAGRDVACWCPLDRACHGDVVLRVAAGGIA